MENEERMENVVISEEEETKVKKNFDPIGAGVLTLAAIGFISVILRFVGWIKSLVIKKKSKKADATIEAEVEVEETAGDEPAKTEEKEAKKKK